MVSYKNLFLIKGMTYWNGVTDWIRRAGSRANSWYESVMYWFDPNADTWYLYPHSVFPVSYRHLYGREGSAWLYRPDTKELVYRGERDVKEKGEPHIMAWLSARTTGKGISKDMDGFLGELRVYPNGHDLPLTVLLQAWSLYDRYWWSADASVRIEWIDRMAEEHATTVAEEILLPLLPHRPSLDKN